VRRPTDDELVVVGVRGPLEVTFQLTGDAVDPTAAPEARSQLGD